MGRNYERMRELEKRVFVGGMVGAVGTQASFGPHAPQLEERVMKRLGLGLADSNWQPARDRLAEDVSVLGIIAGTLGKIANEIVTLEPTAIAELYDPFSEGKLGSSTMPHKRNPSTCEAVVANSRAIRYNVAFMLECMIIEHERDGSAWRGEWKALPESCLMMGGMLSMMKYVLQGLDVSVEDMRRNLDRLGGFLLSERVMFVLSAKLGKQTAHELVYEAAMHGIENRVTFERALLENQKVRDALSSDELRAALDPVQYLGHAEAIVERVLKEQESWLSA
jgi:adenylosuccinate lyase